MESKTRLFQLLKPPCVRLNAAAINSRSGKGDSKELIRNLDELLRVLQAVDASAQPVDDKLADYVFFPLSHIFRDRQTTPSRVLELALECLKLLLRTGWREITNPDLGIQLLILLTFLAGPGQVNNQKQTISDEMRHVAFGCEAALFTSVSRSSPSRHALLNTQNIPALGHAITVMLEGAKDGTSSDVQLSALCALQSFLVSFPDREMISSFFPGIVSSLTQVLTPSTKTRRSFKVLAESLSVLTNVLRFLLSDLTSATTLPIVKTNKAVKSNAVTSNTGDSWLKATAAQMKLALANIVRLRRHDREEVRIALSRLCWTVLRDCQLSLPESAAMMLDTLIDIAQGDINVLMGDSLEQLLISNSSLAELLRDTLYERITTLPRIMQSNDDSTKQRTITHIATSYSLLMSMDLDMTIIDRVILSNLSESVVNVIHEPAKVDVISEHKGLEESARSLQILPSGDASSGFAVVLTGNKSGSEALSELQNLIRKAAGSNTGLRMARDSLDNAQRNEGDIRLANLWLALTILKERGAQDSDLAFDNFIQIQPASCVEQEVFDDLYAFALSLLTHTDQITSDWRHQALALEALAFQAMRLQASFRVELVDALYPVVHLMGSPIQPLRDHAMTCLNIMATACGYDHARDLLISNVDYLVNAIGIKLNTFDISPEAPKVLLMMIRLCGPKLLLYLEDLVDGIFEALECFHGYPALVELLFSVLNGVVEEGAKAPQFSINVGEKVSHLKPDQRPTSVQDVITASRGSRANRGIVDDPAPPVEELPVKAPHRPFTDLPHDKDPPLVQDEEDVEDEGPEPTHDEPKPPLTKTYTLLQRITSLTQHHLPSSSPSIRTSLLTLLSTALPYLSHHPDTFLPLVHTLWPILLPRLTDRESFVVAGTLDALGAICEGAGDFVSSRVQDLWPSVVRIWKDVAAASTHHQGPKPPNNATSFTTSGSANQLAAGPPMTSLAPVNLQVQLPHQHSNRNTSTALTAPSSTQSLGHHQPHLSRVSTTTTTATTSTPHSQTVYIPTTTLAVRAALTRFLLNLIQHVRVSEAVFAKVAGEMLREGLVREGSSEAVGSTGGEGGSRAPAGKGPIGRALAARNPDAVWLVLERARWEGGRRREEAAVGWWDGRKPEGVGWVGVVG